MLVPTAFTFHRRSGFAVEGGYLQAPVRCLRSASRSSTVRRCLPPDLFEHIPDMQATMLQPVGGMDRIAHAIYDEVKPLVNLKTPVSAIRRSGHRVRVEHGPGKQAIDADYRICTLPLPILARIPTDFSAAKTAAIAAAPACISQRQLAFERRASGKPTIISSVESPGPHRLTKRDVSITLDRFATRSDHRRLLRGLKS